MNDSETVSLERISPHPPSGLAELLDELGDGENGFGGTPIHSGAMTLDTYLQRCIELADPANVPPELVPQTTFWVVDGDGLAVGMVRMRHMLNERLREHGGHIGYYIKPGQRGRGYGRVALRRALAELRALGEPRALLTVDLDNTASVRVIEANGGRLESSAVDEDGVRYGRFWIDLQGI